LLLAAATALASATVNCGLCYCANDSCAVQVNEMHLLMAFNSPYVIRAYRCLTYKRILAHTLTDRNDSMTHDTHESLDTIIDSFGGAPLAAAPSIAAAASNSGGKRGSSSSFKHSRSHGGSNSGSNGIVCVVNSKSSRKSNETASSSKGAINEVPGSVAVGQSRGTPGSIVGGLIHAHSSNSLHATPNGGRSSNNGSSVQMTPGGNVHTSRSSGGGKGSRASHNVPDGVNMLATWLVQVSTVGFLGDAGLHRLMIHFGIDGQPGVQGLRGSTLKEWRSILSAICNPSVWTCTMPDGVNMLATWLLQVI
jgi:hypothetical protein